MSTHRIFGNAFGAVYRAGVFWFATVLGLGGCAGHQREDRPPPTAISVPGWGGLETQLEGPPQKIGWVTLHHQGEIWPEGKEVAPYLRALQRWSRESKAWRDIPYHYIVAPDGKVYAARPLGLAGDTNTAYDPRGHALVMLLGNFEVQSPTAAQLEATEHLVAGLLRQHGLGIEQLGTHRQHTHQTVCPGENFMAQLPALRARIQARIRAAGP